MDIEEVAAHSPTRIADANSRAAVLVPILDIENEPQLLFTKRTDHLTEFPGQMSFPGGSRENEDTSLIDTALREADEEIGLHPDEATVIGRLDELPVGSQYVVTPIVAIIPNRTYEPNEAEVAEIVTIAVEDLRHTATYETKPRDDTNQRDGVFHYFHIDDYTVWGASGRILVRLLTLGTEWVPETCEL